MNAAAPSKGESSAHPLGSPQNPFPTKGDDRCRLYVTVVEARGLRAGDSNGSSDPYVKLVFNASFMQESKQLTWTLFFFFFQRLMDGQGLHMKGNSYKTAVKKKTLNPVWNQSWEFDCNYKLSFLEFRVYDHDVFSKDDELGYVYVPVDHLLDQQEHERWYYLRPLQVRGLFCFMLLAYSKQSETQGELKLKLRMELGFPVLLLGQAAVIHRDEAKERSSMLFGLGWDVSPERKDHVNLDASVIGFSIIEKTDKKGNAIKKLKVCEMVTEKRMIGFNGAVVHSGDSISGEGTGDDEEISVDVASLAPDTILAFVVTSFSHQKFSQLKSAYVRCRLKDEQATRTFAYSRLGGQEDLQGTGLLVGYMYRYEGEEWRYKAVQEVSPTASKAEDMVSTVLRFVEKDHLSSA
ncbi:E3 ubiquitin-protein ligase [Balamuthia mandrillaris]